MMIISNSAGSKIIYPEVRLTEVDSSVRVKKTLTTLAKTGGLTLLSVFIPILHFILVPVGVIVTATMTYRAFHRNYVIDSIEIHCPSCDKKSTQSVSAQELPIRTLCLHCGHMVYLTNEHANA
jgi:hypothetical protein